MSVLAGARLDYAPVPYETGLVKQDGPLLGAAIMQRSGPPLQYGEEAIVELLKLWAATIIDNAATQIVFHFGALVSFAVWLKERAWWAAVAAGGFAIAALVVARLA